ncbi:MAG TPA: aspartate aminotransferase family protein [Solirubrobacteraceae bacterium]|nr:aspartate aminotransferase family protein [Solirubrobacteraceae bacterium]
MSVPAVLHPFAAPAREASEFLEIVRAQGCRLHDAGGREYLDGTAALWFCAAGHGRREIAEAVARQMGELDAFHTFGSFTNPPEQRLAEMLSELAPIPGARVLWVNSGSEAIDSALKLARAAHRAAGEGGRTIFLSRTGAYHGVMLGGTSVGGLPANRAQFGPLLSDCFQVERDSLDAMRAAIAYHGPDRIAAILTEPVQGAGGVFPPPDGYLQGLRELCDECGALLIFDEVITGFGRLGSWFASHHYGVTPDLTTFAKAVTSGYLPLGGVVVGPRVRERLESDPALTLAHGGTYAGHPTCCAAAAANLRILRDEGLVERARASGARLRAGLDALASDHDQIAEVRGVGLMQAIGLRPTAQAAAVVSALLRRGVVGRLIPSANTVAFSPPLIISDGEIDELLTALEGALTEAAAAA